MTNIEDRALDHLKQPRTCSALGAYLWEDYKLRFSQTYARPAGKLIRRLVSKGKVRRIYPGGWEHRSPLYQAVEVD